MDGPPFVYVFLRCPWVRVVGGGLRVVGGTGGGGASWNVTCLLIYLPRLVCKNVVLVFLGAEVGAGGTARTSGVGGGCFRRRPLITVFCVWAVGVVLHAPPPAYRAMVYVFGRGRLCRRSALGDEATCMCNWLVVRCRDVFRADLREHHAMPRRLLL